MSEKIPEQENLENKTEELLESDRILAEMEKTREEWKHATEDEEPGFRKKIAELEGKLIKARETEK